MWHIYVCMAYICDVYVCMVCVVCMYMGDVVYIYMGGLGGPGYVLYLLRDHSSSLEGAHSRPGNFADSQGPWLCVS